MPEQGIAGTSRVTVNSLARVKRLCSPADEVYLCSKYGPRSHVPTHRTHSLGRTETKVQLQRNYHHFPQAP